MARFGGSALLVAAVVIVLAIAMTEISVEGLQSDARMEAAEQETARRVMEGVGAEINARGARMALDQAVDVIAKDPVLAARALAGDWSAVNSVLSVLSIDIPLGSVAEKPLVLWNAVCLSGIINTPFDPCVTVWIYFVSKTANCRRIEIKSDLAVEARRGNSSVHWRARPDMPDLDARPCQETSNEPCEKDLCGVQEFTTIIDGLFEVTSLKSDGSRGCLGLEYDESFGDASREEYLYGIKGKDIFMECEAEVKVVHSARDFFSVTIIDPDDMADDRQVGTVVLNATFDVDFKQMAVSPGSFSKRAPLFSSTVPEKCDLGSFDEDIASDLVNCPLGQEDSPECDPLKNAGDCSEPIFRINDINYAYSGLGYAEVNFFGIDGLTLETQLQDMDQIATESTNGKDKGRTLGPLQLGISEQLAIYSDQFAEMVTGFSDSENARWDIQPARSVRLDEDALGPEQALNPVPAINLLVDLGDNLLVDALDLFPGSSKWIAGEDPDAENPGTRRTLTALYDSLTNTSEVVMNEDADPIFGIVDTFLGTSFASKPRGSAHTIDLLALLAKMGPLLGQDEMDPTQGFKIDQAIELVENSGAAFIVNITIYSGQLDIIPREDAFVDQRSNWLDRVNLAGAQTLIIPAIEGFDFRLDLSAVIRIQFLGGKALIGAAPDESEAGDGIFDGVLESLPGFDILEDFTLEIDWLDFFIEAAVLLAVDELAIRHLELGPLTEHLFDCFWSTCFVTPQLSQLKLNSGGSRIYLTDNTPASTEGFFYLVQVALNEISPIFVGILPLGIAEVANTYLVGKEFLPDTECPKTIQERPGTYFKWTGTFMDLVRDQATQENLSDLLNGIFPKGDTPDTEDWNQVIQEPLELFRVEDLPSQNGLNVTLEFIISKFELQGISPVDYSDFILLDVNASNTDDYPYGLYTKIGVNQLRFAIELEINTFPDRVFRRALFDDNIVDDNIEDNWDNGKEFAPWSLEHRRSLQAYGEPTIAPTPRPTFEATAYPTIAPTLPYPTAAPSVSPTNRPTPTPPAPTPAPIPAGAQINKLRLEASFENIFALIDLLLKFYEYDVISTTVEDAFSLWCWVAKLQPFGGIKDVAVRIANGDLDFQCITCSNDVLREIARRFNNDQADIEFFKLVNDGLDFAAQIIINLSNEENWEKNMADVRRWCQGLPSVERSETFEPLKEDLLETYAFLFTATLAMGGMAFVSCCCIENTHTHKRLEPKLGKKALAGKKMVAPELRLQVAAQVFEDIDNYDHVLEELEHTPLYNHPAVPAFWRIAIPGLLILNIALFVIGHVGKAVTTSIYVSVAGVPVELEDFQSISVIQSATAVWDSGGYALAVLIVLMSIMWPYVKIFGMAFAWFSNTRAIGFHKRGALIKRLDQLGKWSLVELFLLLVILVTFRLQVKSPDITFAPGGFYSIRLGIDPQLSIYTFCTALVMSLATSNMIEWWHEQIEKKIATLYRAPKLSDDFAISMVEYKFSVTGRDYTLGVTWIGTALLICTTLCAVGLKIIAASEPVLGTEILGLARLVIEAEGKSAQESYSLFTFFLIIFQGESAGEMYLGAFFALTVLGIPVMQLVMLLYLLLGRFTLKSACFWFDINKILSAWACSEVFLLGIAFTILELGQISGNLAKRQCSFLQPIMANQLEPTGLVTETDVAASCFTLVGTIGSGMYFIFLSVVLANIAHYAVTVSFLKFIQKRLGIKNAPSKRPKATSFLETGCIASRCLRKESIELDIEI